ncbi:YdeI/OmpD-associated family protein [Ideonella sp. BN130291]|uniref:YdeI/OmpD-associated family protein n=1 Tax=Ideonella sp. BN130291 TaxID=3112940 RepID=UPI002E258985|nr:YdeI/OmpD-associated family protein [Ideonella sp. BN130291]
MPTKTAPAPTEEPLRLHDTLAWERWLKRHHAGSDGVWLEIAKKGAPEPTLSYAEALEVALCYGWIDGQKKGGEPYWLQRFTPRRARSIWSKVNRAKAEALIEQGRMQPAGLKEVERAKADGRWADAYDSPSQASVSPELQAAFDANPKAAAFFATLDSTNRYAVLWRVQTAKRPETRAKRIAQLVEMLARHEKLHP